MTFVLISETYEIIQTFRSLSILDIDLGKILPNHEEVEFISNSCMIIDDCWILAEQAYLNKTLLESIQEHGATKPN